MQSELLALWWAMQPVVNEPHPIHHQPQPAGIGYEERRTQWDIEALEPVKE